MRYSQYLLPTLKESPKDAEIVSHQLMVRCGMIRRVAAGIYSLLPLGQRVMQKFEGIVRDEMNASGGQEVLLPSVVPAELWKKSGRWELYGKELLRFKDRLDRDFCFAPTHEEVILELVGQSAKSYKSLPMLLYQIQTKFRDETRPRFGLMRGREFSMKDAYSFHADSKDLDAMYRTMKAAYERIFTRCGLRYKQVLADSGNIGGSESAEFMVTSDTGEDQIVQCTHCDFAANVEVVADKKSCPKCKSGQLELIRGIEVGHIFKLGNKYSEAMDVGFLNQDGQRKHYEMGCYGIGIGRTVAAAIEQHHDDKGIIWPLALAPFQVDLIVLSMKEEVLAQAGDTLYEGLQTAGLDVLFDDRADTVGVKFKDADLLGFPFQVIVGRSFKNGGKVEIKIRKTGEIQLVPLDECVSVIKQLISDGL